MDREILFKAKTEMIVGTYNCGKDDGEWVKGYLYNDIGKWIIRQFEFDRADYVSYEVNPDTICQFTGYIHNENKKWEGDIFAASDGEYIQRYIIQWDEDALQWYAVCPYNSENDLPLCEFRPSEIEVIGNIFDNPELLEVPQ